MKKTPNWTEVLKENQTWATKLATPELMALVTKANREYLHWERFKFQPMPKDVKPELAWALVKLMRQSTSEQIPFQTEMGQLTVSLNKDHFRDLSFIDRYCSGSIISADSLPDGVSKSKLIISGLIEEAISSSQIEGANTTRKVAKEMIELNRKPKNRDEQMIFNNFVAMNRLEEWKKRKLDEAFLLELHSVLAVDTMDNEDEVGRFRTDKDEIVVSDKVTGEVVHVPPPEKLFRDQLKQLYRFANEDNDSSYIHPFVKASILHFCLGYIHPFVDGNGRSARALFYWYLLKQDYWMFEFLPISLQIKKKEWRPGYDRAFQQTETDSADFTYFLNYKLKLACNAIADFRKYLEKKQKEARSLKQRLVDAHEINQRQIELIEFFQAHPNAEIDVFRHQEKTKVVYQTARTDLLSLADRKILKQQRIGRRFVFTRGEKFPS